MSIPLCTRKALHAVLAVVFAYLGIHAPITVVMTLVVVLALVFYAAMRLHFLDPVRRAEQPSYGELFFVLGVFITAALYLPHATDAFVAGMFVLGFADTLASLVGRMWGVKTYTVFGEVRTYGGSFTVLLVAVVILSWFGMGLWPALLAGWLLATLEALAPRGSDNLMLPIVTGALVSFFLL